MYLAFLSPLISIIIPVKNAFPWLDECLESIAAQSCRNWECILVDDGSSDGSAQLLSVYSFYDGRFRVFQNEGDGLIAAYSTGLKHSRGTYITRMDADDIMPPERLEKMLNAISQAPENTVVTGKVNFFPESEKGVGTRFYEDWLNRRMEVGDHWDWIWRECVVPSPCWMATKKTLVDFNLFGDLQYPEDYHLAFKWYEHGFRILAIPEVLHLWRQHSGRYSRISDNYSAEKFMEMKWAYFKRLKLPDCEHLYVLGTGAKAKYLARLILGDQIPFTWISHEKNLAGNVFLNQRIRYVQEVEYPQPSVVISTLSSIDRFEREYGYFEKLNIPVFRFC